MSINENVGTREPSYTTRRSVNKTPQLLWKAIGPLLKQLNTVTVKSSNSTPKHTPKKAGNATTHTHLYTNVRALFLTAQNGNDANVHRQKCE